MTCEHQEKHPLSWHVAKDPHRPDYEHVVPLNDTKDHRYTDCWCQPELDGYAIGHNAHDHREDYFEHKTRKVN